MPVMDGLEMCRQIRKFAPLSTIPIILLTAKDDRETEQQSIDLNIDVFLPKPFEVPTLTARVGQLLGNKKRMEQRIRMEMLTSPGSNRELSQDEKFMKKVTQLIEEHLDDADLSVSRLCDLGDFSESSISAPSGSRKPPCCCKAAISPSRKSCTRSDSPMPPISRAPSPPRTT